MGGGEEDDAFSYTENNASDKESKFSTLDSFRRLTATTNAQNDKMVKRAAFLYADDDLDLHKAMLQHLRLFRNSTVHTGQRSERIQKIVYQLKRYVELLLIYNIQNPMKFNSLEETATFLDLPTDSSLMKERIRLLNKGIKFRK